MIDGFWMARDMSSGVIVRPIASMRMDSEVCITDSDPTVWPIKDEYLIAVPAESNVQRGDNLQKVLEASENETRATKSSLLDDILWLVIFTLCG